LNNRVEKSFEMPFDTFMFCDNNNNRRRIRKMNSFLKMWHIYTNMELVQNGIPLLPLSNIITMNHFSLFWFDEWIFASISSTLNVQIFHTNFGLAAFSSYFPVLASKFRTKNALVNIDEIDTRCQFHRR